MISIPPLRNLCASIMTLHVMQAMQHSILYRTRPDFAGLAAYILPSLAPQLASHQLVPHSSCVLRVTFNTANTDRAETRQETPARAEYLQRSLFGL